MKNKDYLLIIRSVYSLGKKIVQDNFSEEIKYYDVIWRIIQDYIYKWRYTNPEKWLINETQEKVLNGLGFADVSQALDLVTPVIVTSLSATMVAIRDLRYIPKEHEINMIIDRYAPAFGARRPLVNLMKKYIKELCEVLPEIMSMSEETREPLLGQIKEEDTLEIGFSDGRPLVKINGREDRKYRTKYKQYSNLVLLAVARKNGEGWISKGDLDLGESDQALSDIRYWICSLLKYDADPLNVIKQSEKKEKTIRLDVFKPKDITIKKSICDFKSRSESRVRRLVKQAENRMSQWERGDRKDLLDGRECEQLDRERAIMWTQMDLIQKGVKKMGWELNNHEWNDLWKKSKEILKSCGHEIKHI